MQPKHSNTTENEITIERVTGTAFDCDCGCTCYVSRVIPVLNFIDTKKSVSTLELVITDFCGKKHFEGMMSEKFYLDAKDFIESISRGWGDPNMKYNSTKTLERKAIMKGHRDDDLA